MLLLRQRPVIWPCEERLPGRLHYRNTSQPTSSLQTCVQSSWSPPPSSWAFRLSSLPRGSWSSSCKKRLRANVLSLGAMASWILQKHEGEGTGLNSKRFEPKAHNMHPRPRPDLNCVSRNVVTAGHFCHAEYIVLNEVHKPPWSHQRRSFDTRNT